MLTQRDNVKSVTDPRDNTWLDLTYTDADGDSRRDEITQQIWGGYPLSILYDFTARQTTVTDRRGHPWTHVHNEAGQEITFIDPLGGELTHEHNGNGLLSKVIKPLGGEIRFTWDTSEDFRSQGSLVGKEVVPDSRGSNTVSPNGCSPAEEQDCAAGLICLCSYTTTVEKVFDPYTNLDTSQTDRRGFSVSIQRNSETGAVESVAGPEGMSKEYVHNDFGQLIQEVNGRDNVTVYRYFEDGPSRGYLKEIEVADLVLTKRETDARGNVTAFVDGRGVRTEMEYNELDQVVKITRALSGATDGSGAPALAYVTEYAYDENGNRIEEYLPFGENGQQQTVNVSTFGILNENLTQTREILPGGATTLITYEYDENFNNTKVTDPEGHVTDFTYDERNLKTAASFGDGLITESYGYDVEWNRFTRTDGRSKVWQTEYDGKGRVKKSTDPLGNYTTTAYDEADNVTRVQAFDSEGTLLAQTDYTYDGLGRLSSVGRHLLDTGTVATETLTYDLASNVATSKDAEGHLTTYTYDVAERLVEILDPEGNRTVYDLDLNGNPTTMTTHDAIPGGGSVQVEELVTYDALNRPLTTTDALSNTITFIYEARDNVLSVTDPEGFESTYTYDALDRMLSSSLPEGVTGTYTYDKSSNLLTYTDALGGETSYTYDAANRQKTVTYPDLTTWQFGYDGAGNLEQTTDANQTTVTYTYDDAGRPIATTVVPGPGVEGVTAESMTWDGLNRITYVQYGSVTTDLTYDSLSRLKSETTLGRTVSYDYDKAGNQTDITYPSGLVVHRTFDDLNRAETMTHSLGGVDYPAVGYQYRGVASLHQKSLGNSVVGSAEYDETRRLIEHTWVDGGQEVVLNEQLAWSPRGLEISRMRGDLPSASRIMAYDGIARLLGEGRTTAPRLNNSNPPLPSEVAGLSEGSSYQYDEGQNLIARGPRRDGLTEEVDLPVDPSKRNRPVSVGEVGLSWDANGNLTQKGDLSFFYDFRDRLVRVAQDGIGTVATYEYDAQGRRVRKTVSSDVTETVWSSWRSIEEHKNSQLSTRRTFGSGLDEIVYAETDLDADGTLETKYVPLYDETGNLVVVTDSDGRPIEKYDYSSYGEQQILADDTPPVIEQVRVVGDDLWVEVSEDLSAAVLSAAVSNDQLVLVDASTQQLLPISVYQPVSTGRHARQRLVISATDPPVAGSQLTLRFEPEALVDPFLNRPASAFELTFTWPASDAVLQDAASPEVTRVALASGQLEIELSEQVDLTSAATAILLDGQPLTWTLDATSYVLRSTETVAVGSHTLDVGTGLLDLAGSALSQAYQTSFDTVDAAASGLLDAAPDPRRASSSAVANLFGYHGRPVDPETGLMYFRNRYYDPELGRFISVDPMGYADGPSMYQFALNSPSNYSDPLGLCIDCDIINFVLGTDVRSEDIEPLVEKFEETLDVAGAVIKEATLILAEEVIFPIGIANDLSVLVLGYDFLRDETVSDLEQDLSALTLLPGVPSFFRRADDVVDAVDVGHDMVKAAENAVDAGSSVGRRAARRIEDAPSITRHADKSEDARDVMRRGDPPCPLNCFAAGTLISTEDGLRPIEEIEEGDRVWAFNEETGKVELAEVVRLFDRVTLEVYELRIGDAVIETTAEHPFWVVGRSWVEVEDLQAGDILRTYEGQELRLVAVERQERVLRVFNFEVRGLHTYFVGDSQALVHNCSRKPHKLSAREPVVTDELLLNSKIPRGTALSRVPDFSDNQAAFRHYAKHSKGVVIGKNGKLTVKPGGADLPEFTSFAEYRQAARRFFSGPGDGLQQGVRANGDIVRFNPKTGHFGVMSQDGVIQTFFRPDNPAAYFASQF